MSLKTFLAIILIFGISAIKKSQHREPCQRQLNCVESTRGLRNSQISIRRQLLSFNSEYRLCRSTKNSTRENCANFSDRMFDLTHPQANRPTGATPNLHSLNTVLPPVGPPVGNRWSFGVPPVGKGGTPVEFWCCTGGVQVFNRWDLGVALRFKHCVNKRRKHHMNLNRGFLAMFDCECFELRYTDY
ncbi:unnamed protein product [Caenorhabditis angaria]|uniref:Uncharacterized protein n=1 Tax=Caenorhabditis angaria TaxID=860376 RepID=A0A9P1IDA6_9PELO|nr:unnamed protein product [Caenorhabditis angaria]